MWYDQSGDPLFADLNKNFGSPGEMVQKLYISKEYESNDLSLLQNYGLRWASWGDYIDRIAQDLDAFNGQSRMRDPATGLDWHSRAVAGLTQLHSDAQRLGGACLNRFMSLSMIPLNNGAWIPPNIGSVYYAHCSGHLEIPDGLGFQLVNGKAASNRDKRKFYDLIGVLEADFNLVRSRILEKPAPFFHDRNSLLMPVKYLRFLYLSHGLSEANYINGGHFSKQSSYQVYNEDMRGCQPYQKDIYLPSTHKYGPTELFKPTKSAPEGFPAPFLHGHYLKDQPKTPVGQKLTYIQWLEQYLRLRPRIEITQNLAFTSPRISKAFQYIAKAQPENVVNILRHHWKHEGPAIRQSQKLINDLRELPVACQGGRLWKLRETYLPLRELEEKVAHYMDVQEFKFLKLDEVLCSGSYRPHWGFLVDTIGLSDCDNMRFYSDLLLCICREQGNDGNPTPSANRKVLDLYKMMYTRYMESDNQPKMRTTLR